MSIRNDEIFSIDYFLNSIEASTWETFINAYFIKRDEVVFYESKHRLALMAAYSPSFFEGINFNPTHEADVDF